MALSERRAVRAPELPVQVERLARQVGAVLAKFVAALAASKSKGIFHFRF